MAKSTTIVAFDQHVGRTVAAVLLPGQRTPAVHQLISGIPTILRFVERVRRAGPVQCCYEAGPCGFELQRALTAHRIPCDVIAPALIPRRPGESHQDGSSRCRPARRAGSRGRAHPHPHSHRAGRGRARFAALSRRHSRRSPPRSASAFAFPPAARPPLYRDQEGVDETARGLVAGAAVAAARPRADPSRLRARR
jgi:hypothetical protein